MRSPGRGRGDGASAFRDGGATSYITSHPGCEAYGLRLSVRHYECRYAEADRNTQSGGEKVNKGNRIGDMATSGDPP
jgi:hypothetical protein